MGVGGVTWGAVLDTIGVTDAGEIYSATQGPEIDIHLSSRLNTL
jgi:hypothetical protein